MKKGILKISQNSHLYHSVFLNKNVGLKPANLFKKKPLAQVFYREFCEIFKDTFFTEYLLATT